MRVFACPKCRAWIEFEDRVCLACGTQPAYAPAFDELVRAGEHPLCRFRDALGCSWVASPARPPRRVRLVPADLVPTGRRGPHRTPGVARKVGHVHDLVRVRTVAAAA